MYPRLVTPPVPPVYAEQKGRVSSGVDGLDEVLGGGLWRGANTLVIGEAGTGKTTLGLCFAAEGVCLGEPSLYLNFQENPIQLARMIRGLSLDRAELESKGLILRYSSPVELQIDSIIVDLVETVHSKGIKRVIIDALGDLSLAAGDADRFHDYVYSLVQHFSTSGVTSLMLMEKADPLGVLRGRECDSVGLHHRWHHRARHRFPRAQTAPHAARGEAARIAS